MNTSFVIPHSREVLIERTIKIIECCECSVDFGIGAEFMKSRRRDHGWFYCPNGHSQHYSQDNAEEKAIKQAELARKEAARLKTALEWSRTAERSARDQAEAAERSRAAQKGVNTKLKRRIANGVCPCCNRSFKDLHRHMSGQHPDYVPESDG